MLKQCDFNFESIERCFVGVPHHFVKMYSNHFVKPMIPAAKVNYELMVDIKCLLTLVAVLPLLEVVKALVVFGQSP
jgi:hypothetical protein